MNTESKLATEPIKVKFRGVVDDEKRQVYTLSGEPIYSLHYYKYITSASDLNDAEIMQLAKGNAVLEAEVEFSRAEIKFLRMQSGLV